MSGFITADEVTERHVNVIAKEVGADIDLAMCVREAKFDPATTNYPAHRRGALVRIAKVWNYRYAWKSPEVQERVLSERGDPT